MKTLLKNGVIIDYKTNRQEELDILIENNKIIKIEKSIAEDADKTMDCSGLYIMPGMIDVHCHLREPGFEYKETIETGSKSAVKGGFTTICPMPNTKPTPDTSEVLEKIISEAKRVNLCNVLPYASVTCGEKGEELVNFEALKKAGAVAFSDDGIPVTNARIMREAIISADKLGTFVASHCEEKSVADRRNKCGTSSQSIRRKRSFTRGRRDNGSKRDCNRFYKYCKGTYMSCEHPRFYQFSKRCESKRSENNM